MAELVRINGMELWKDRQSQPDIAASLTPVLSTASAKAKRVWGKDGHYALDKPAGQRNY